MENTKKKEIEIKMTPLARKARVKDREMLDKIAQEFLTGLNNQD